VIDRGYDDVESPLTADLDPSCAWTLTHLAEPIASGWQLKKAAAAAGVSTKRASQLLDELQDALAHRSPTRRPPKRWTRPKPAKAAEERLSV
jgi:hypothetical protein